MNQPTTVEKNQQRKIFFIPSSFLAKIPKHPDGSDLSTDFQLQATWMQRKYVSRVSRAIPRVVLLQRLGVPPGPLGKGLFCFGFLAGNAGILKVLW